MCTYTFESDEASLQFANSIVQQWLHNQGKYLKCLLNVLITHGVSMLWNQGWVGKTDEINRLAHTKKAVEHHVILA